MNKMVCERAATMGVGGSQGLPESSDLCPPTVDEILGDARMTLSGDGAETTARSGVGNLVGAEAVVAQVRIEATTTGKCAARWMTCGHAETRVVEKSTEI